MPASRATASRVDGGADRRDERAPGGACSASPSATLAAPPAPRGCADAGAWAAARCVVAVARTPCSPHRVGHAFGWISVGRTAALARHLIAAYNVKAGGPDATAKSLSGGNLQKFIVGREIDAHPKLLIVSQPTWGVDVGAAAQIRGALLALRDAGCAVLVVSEDLDELFEISDRLVVIARGRVSPSIPAAQATREQIGQWMSGLWHENAGAPASEALHAAA